MYHHFVITKVNQVFDKISNGEWEVMVTGLASEFTYRFYGEHCLGGERHTKEAMRLWWMRIFRILSNVRFEPQEILVKGWPWSTRVAARVIIHGVLPDGSSYENTMHQFMRLRWGKVTAVYTLEDTQKLQAALDRAAAAGVAEAHAAPITDKDAVTPGSVRATRPSNLP